LLPQGSSEEAEREQQRRRAAAAEAMAKHSRTLVQATGGFVGLVREKRKYYNRVLLKALFIRLFLHLCFEAYLSCTRVHIRYLY